jgi:hypothetical protein
VTFLDLVNAELMPAIAPLGFAVVQSSVADSFDNASVELEGLAFRLRAFRERGDVFVDIGPASEPGQWLDSDLMLEYLGLMSSTSDRSREASAALGGAAAWVTTFHAELSELLDAQHLPATRRVIGDLGEQRAARMFGP